LANANLVQLVRHHGTALVRDLNVLVKQFSMC